MEIAYPATIVLAGIVIAVVLYVVGVRRKARRKIASEAKNELRQDETRPTVLYGPPLHTQAAESVQPEREVPSVKVESKPEKVAEEARPFIQSSEPSVEARPTELAQQGVLESPKGGQPHPKKEGMFCEVVADREVQPAQLVTETHAEKLEERAEDPEPTASTKEANPSAAEPTGGGVRQGPHGAQDERTPQEPRRVSPEKRGGRSRVGERQSEKEQTNKGRPRNPKPEIVCWKRDREWVLAVEIPEELRTISVVQNGIPLTEDNLKQGYWRLATLGGEVVVSVVENESECQSKVVLGDNNYLVFKLSGAEQNQGRHVKQPTYGSYLVVALADWQRDEVLAGPAPAEPEDVCLQSYRAHFFNLGANRQR